jgi:hypothetical protein
MTTEFDIRAAAGRLIFAMLSALAFSACTRSAPVVGEMNAPLTGSDVHAPILTSTQRAAPSDYVQYPEELHGLWIGLTAPCPERGGSVDTDLILDISTTDIVGYEEVLRATQISAAPPPAKSWRIETVIDVGPDGIFSKHGPITFTISGNELSVADGPLVETYRKCSLDRTAVEYPPELRGAWMPSDMGCPSSINPDGEDLLSIGAGMLGQYENTSKPLRVDQVSKTPYVWRVLTTFSPGTGEYEGADFITFKLTGSTLLIQTKSAISTYVKCR